MVTADHGPAVSGAHNTIVCARAGKDLVSCLASGLLTIVSQTSCTETTLTTKLRIILHGSGNMSLTKWKKWMIWFIIMPYNVQYVYDTFEVKGEWKFAMSINLLCVFESTVFYWIFYSLHVMWCTRQIVNENTLMSYENYLIHVCTLLLFLPLGRQVWGCPRRCS